VNFGVMPVKGYARIEADNAHKTCSLDAKLFLGIEKRPVFDQMLLVFKKKKKWAGHE